MIQGIQQGNRVTHLTTDAGVYPGKRVVTMCNRIVYYVTPASMYSGAAVTKMIDTDERIGATHVTNICRRCAKLYRRQR